MYARIAFAAINPIHHRLMDRKEKLELLQSHDGSRYVYMHVCAFLGDKFDLDGSEAGERWSLPIHLLDAIFYTQPGNVTTFERRGLAMDILRRMSVAVQKGIEGRHIQRLPHGSSWKLINCFHSSCLPEFFTLLLCDAQIFLVSAFYVSVLYKFIDLYIAYADLDDVCSDATEPGVLQRHHEAYSSGVGSSVAAEAASAWNRPR